MIIIMQYDLYSQNISSIKKRVERKLDEYFSISENSNRLIKRSKIVSNWKNILDKSHDIEKLPMLLLKMVVFKGYSSCQLIIHERGKKNIENHYYNRMGLSKSIHSISDFNRLYRIIKKSKSKIFYKDEILNDFPGVLAGAFLGKEIDLKDHSMIFIVSRDDFLPPVNEEIIFFEKLSSEMNSIFEFILFKDKLSKEQQYFSLCLENLPFDNNKIESSNILECSTGDIYHYQRVLLLGELLNTLKHELSNPLFGIKLTADLLQEDCNNAEIKEMFSNISQNCIRCQEIIKNFSYLYSSNDNRENVDLYKVIQEAFILSKSITVNIKKSILVKKSESDELQNLCNSDIFANIIPTLLGQILLNLIINSAQAINSMDRIDRLKGEIIVLVECRAEMISIIVFDSGPGIKNIRDKIFKPFYTTKSTGTGLGLSICNGLIKRMDGNISSLELGLLPGATFKLELPHNNE